MGQSQTVIDARRRQVAGLWLRGVHPARIATMVNASRPTIDRDIRSVRDELTRLHADSLEAKAARSVAHLRLVQEEAWALYGRTRDANSAKTGALNTIANTEVSIARIEGTLSGDYVTQQTINVIGGAEWQMLRGLVLHALDAHPDARRDVVAALLEAQASAAAAPTQEDQEGGASDDADEDDDLDDIGG